MTSRSESPRMVLRKEAKLEVKAVLEALGLSGLLTLTLTQPGPENTIHIHAAMPVELAEFDDDDIIKEHERRFGFEPDVINDLYRHLGEGNINAAMDLMAAEFGLAHPSHEKKRTDLIARGRAKEASHAEN